MSELVWRGVEVMEIVEKRGRGRWVKREGRRKARSVKRI
jgi:hypothetical protein